MSRSVSRSRGRDGWVAEVLRRHFLLEIFERIWERNPQQLSEEQAQALAREEPDAMRAERDSRKT